MKIVRIVLFLLLLAPMVQAQEEPDGYTVCMSQLEESGYEGQEITLD